MRGTTKTVAAKIATPLCTDEKDRHCTVAFTTRNASLNAHAVRQCLVINKIMGGHGNNDAAAVEVHLNDTEAAAAAVAGVHPYQEREASHQGYQ